MESLSETTWDVVICGTGLQQSLLALALSRSDKKILHIDPNDHYGGPDAAFSLQDVEEWEASQRTVFPDNASVFRSVSITRPAEATGLSFPRAYSLALSPQLIHAKSALLSQLVSSRAFRQLEFLAVGSFLILDAQGLTRIPSTREDVFSSTALSARAKRSLMKFLKLVLAHDEEPHAQQLEEFADKPLSEFLEAKLNLDAELRTYILALTLSLDGRVNTRQGIETIYRHLTSMGVFGVGFAAVYPKWGGCSEIAQVACRAGAVGGGVYMLGTGIKEVRPATNGEEETEVELRSGVTVRTRLLVQGAEKVSADTRRVSRSIAVVASPLSSLFEVTAEGAPAPAVAVIALPPGSLNGEEDDAKSEYPVYAIAHSSDTGECPAGQSVLYLTTLHTPQSKVLLERSLASVLAALGGDEPPQCLYQVYYEQAYASSTPRVEDRLFSFGAPSVSLAFDDSTLEPVREAWKMVLGEAGAGADVEYMVFEDREGVGDEDDVYDL